MNFHGKGPRALRFRAIRIRDGVYKLQSKRWLFWRDVIQERSIKCSLGSGVFEIDTAREPVYLSEYDVRRFFSDRLPIAHAALDLKSYASIYPDDSGVPWYRRDTRLDIEHYLTDKASDLVARKFKEAEKKGDL